MKIPFAACGAPITATPLDSLGRPCAALLLITIILSGCSVRAIAVNAVADAIADSGATYAADDDITLVGQASPFGLKTTEGLLEEVPDHRGLLLAAVRGFTQYAYVYIEQPANEIEEVDVRLAYAERARARQMYLRARDYGLRGLEAAHPGVVMTIQRDPLAALSKTTADDVALLYWTAAAWASAISLAKDDPALLADLPAVEALIERAYELDESYDHGAIHVFLISYAMSQSGLRQDASSRARQRSSYPMDCRQRRT
jgi:predicted anti-sigma-YlaC factor YlaD